LRKKQILIKAGNFLHFWMGWRHPCCLFGRFCCSCWRRIRFSNRIYFFKRSRIKIQGKIQRCTEKIEDTLYEEIVENYVEDFGSTKLQII